WTFHLFVPIELFLLGGSPFSHGEHGDLSTEAPALLIAELGRWPGGRTLYDPCPGKLTRAGISFLLARF
ncbi:hypothetical protein ACWDNT_34290, partial [Streptomyces sp. NPDC000963]